MMNQQLTEAYGRAVNAVDSETADFETSAYRLVESFEHHPYGFFIKSVYAAFSGEKGRVPELTLIGTWNGTLGLNVQRTSLYIDLYQFPYPFVDYSQMYYPAPEMYEEYLDTLEAARQRGDQNTVVTYEFYTTLIGKQLSAFGETELAEINAVFGPEIAALRRFQESFLQEVADQTPWLRHFDTVMQVLSHQLNARRTYKMADRVPTQAELMAAARAKLPILTQDEVYLATEHERQVAKQATILEEFMTLPATTLDSEADLQGLIHLLEQALEQITREAILGLLPTTTTSFFYVQDEVVTPFKPIIRCDVHLPQDIDRVQVRFATDKGAWSLVIDDKPVKMTAANDRDGIAQYLHGVSPDPIGSIMANGHFVVDKTSHGELDAQTMRRIYMVVLTVKVMETLADMLDALRKDQRRPKLATSRLKRLTDRWKKGVQSIIEENLLKPDLTNVNFAQQFRDITGWSLVKNGNSFYINRAQQLGYTRWNGTRPDTSSAVRDAFDLYQHDTALVGNTSRTEFEKLSQKIMFSYVSQADVQRPESFIEVSLRNREAILDEADTATEHQVHSDKKAVATIRSRRRLLTSSSTELHLPWLVGTVPVSIKINSNERSESISTYFQKDVNKHATVLIPDWATNRDDLTLEVEYAEDENLEQESDIALLPHEREKLKELSFALQQNGFTRLAELIETMLESGRQLSAEDIASCIRSTSLYSYNSSSTLIRDNNVLGSLAGLLDKKSGTFLCQCDSANVLLHFCLKFVFSDTEKISSWLAYGYLLDPIYPDQEHNVALSDAHAVVKVLKNGQAYYFDATPGEEAEDAKAYEKPAKSGEFDSGSPIAERTVIDAKRAVEVSETRDISLFVTQLKEEYLSALKKALSDRIRWQHAFVDRTAPIPRLLDILNEAIATNNINSPVLDEFEERVEALMVGYPSPQLASSFRDNYLPNNLDLYVLIKDILARLRSHQRARMR